MRTQNVSTGTASQEDIDMSPRPTPDIPDQLPPKRKRAEDDNDDDDEEVNHFKCLSHDIN